MPFHTVIHHLRTFLRRGIHSPEAYFRLIYVDIHASAEMITKEPLLAPKWIKCVEVLLCPLTTESILTYLQRIGQCSFHQRESSVRYGGENYFAIRAATLHIDVVPASYLGWRVPCRYRQPNWSYVRITCAPEESRFDRFPGYEVVAAHRYHIA